MSTPTEMQNPIAEDREHIEREYQDYLADARSLGAHTMVEMSQPPGSGPGGTQDCFNLQLCKMGSGNVEIGVGGHKIETHNIEPGTLYVSPADTDCTYALYRYSQILILPLKASWVRYVGAEINPRFAGDFAALHSDIFRAPKLAQRMQRLWRAAAPDASTTPLALEAETLALVQDLVHLSSNASALKQQRLYLGTHARRQVLAYVEQHLASNVSLNALAQTANLSEFHFLRAFKADMGVTPHQYVMDQRVQRAKVLLKQNGSDIAKIACNTGFASHQHFTTVFSKTVGRSPSAFRQRASIYIG
jgi:AraC family transcriptional regulator